MIQEPTAWISEDCTPPGFKWKDPSKIQIGEIYRLLDHWKDRQAQGLDPLIWVPSCPLLQNAQKPHQRWRSLQQARASQEQASDEENFDLPSSGDPDNADDADDESDENRQEDNIPDGPGSGDSEMDSPIVHSTHDNRMGSGMYDAHITAHHISHIPLQSLWSTAIGLQSLKAIIQVLTDHPYHVSILSTSAMCY